MSKQVDVCPNCGELYEWDLWPEAEEVLVQPTASSLAGEGK